MLLIVNFQRPHLRKLCSKVYLLAAQCCSSPCSSSSISGSILVLMRLPQCEIVITARSNAGSQRGHLSKHALTFVRSLVAQTFANRDIPRGAGIDFTVHGATAGGRMRVPVLWGWLELVLGMNLLLAYLETADMIAVTSGSR